MSNKGFTVDNKVWEQMKKNLSKDREKSVDIGYFEEDSYGPENDNLPVAQVAKWNNEGSENNPMRPFFYTWIDQLEKRAGKEFVDSVSTYIHLVAMGNLSWEWLYNKIGKEESDKIKDIIKEWSDPPNSASTIAAKGKNDPLIDSEKMLNSTKYKISNKADT